MTPREELAALEELARLEARAANPAEGMPAWEKAAAGFGKAIYDTGRGVGQLFGLVDQQSVDDAKKRDAALMDTGAGLAGNVAGQLASVLAPAGGAMRLGSVAPRLAAAGRGMLMPKTIAGAAAGGAVQGGVQPVASDESRAWNMALGGTGGAAIPASITAARAVKGFGMPFSQGGREQIAGRTLQRFAANPNALTESARELVPGSIPTLAEATQDVGLAQLQRTLRNNPDANMAITQRMIANQEARERALQGIAGDDAKRLWYEAERARVTEPLYKQAFSQTMNESPWIKGELKKLMKRPSMSDGMHADSAWKRARALAAEEGLKLDPTNATQVLHYTKLGLDDMISSAVSAGDKNRARILQGTKAKLLGLMESKDFSPAYREARSTFSDMSKEINQMQLGQELLNKLKPALSDFGATVRATPQKYAEAVKNIDRTAKTATGFKGARAEKILTPEQMMTVQNVARDLGRSVNAQELGMARGSPTGQNLISQDLLRQVLGPTGLPQSLADTALAETFMRPVSWAYKIPENRLLGLLGDAAVDPKLAKELAEMARRASVPSRAERLLPFSAPVGAAGLLNFFQQ